MKPVARALWLLLATILLANAWIAQHAHRMIRYSRPRETSALEALILGVNVPRPENTNTPLSQSLEFSTVNHPSTSPIQLESWFIPKRGSSDLFLMFPGYAKSKSSLLSEARALWELGFSTFLTDFRGTGGSTGNTTTIGFSEADDVLAALDYVTQHFKNRRTLLYGKSLGAAAILRALSLRPELSNLVILESPFDRLLTTVSHRVETMGLPAFPAARLLVFWGGLMSGFSGFSHNPAEYIKTTKSPILIFGGGQDRRVLKGELESFLVRPNIRLVFNSEAGHANAFSGFPEAWKEAVATFVSVEGPH